MAEKEERKLDDYRIGKLLKDPKLLNDVLNEGDIVATTMKPVVVQEQPEKGFKISKWKIDEDCHVISKRYQNEFKGQYISFSRGWYIILRFPDAFDLNGERKTRIFMDVSRREIRSGVSYPGYLNINLGKPKKPSASKDPFAQITGLESSTYLSEYLRKVGIFDSQRTFLVPKIFWNLSKKPLEEFFPPFNSARVNATELLNFSPPMMPRFVDSEEIFFNSMTEVQLDWLGEKTIKEVGVLNIEEATGNVNLAKVVVMDFIGDPIIKGPDDIISIDCERGPSDKPLNLYKCFLELDGRYRIKKPFSIPYIFSSGKRIDLNTLDDSPVKCEDPYGNTLMRSQKSSLTKDIRTCPILEEYDKVAESGIYGYQNPVSCQNFINANNWVSVSKVR
jgi:hypothetical protein